MRGITELPTQNELTQVLPGTILIPDSPEFGRHIHKLAKSHLYFP